LLQNKIAVESSQTMDLFKIINIIFVKNFEDTRLPNITKDEVINETCEFLEKNWDDFTNNLMNIQSIKGFTTRKKI